MVTPFELSAVEVGGETYPVSPVWEGEWWRHTVRVDVPPGESVTVRMELSGSLAPGDVYVLATIGQALLDPGPLTVTVTTPSADFVPQQGVAIGPNSAEVSVELLGDTLIRLPIE